MGVSGKSCGAGGLFGGAAAGVGLYGLLMAGLGLCFGGYGGGWRCEALCVPLCCLGGGLMCVLTFYSGSHSVVFQDTKHLSWAVLEH